MTSTSSRCRPGSARMSNAGNPKADSSASSTATQGEHSLCLNEEHYLSDIRTAAAGAVAARMLAPSNVATAAVLGAGVQGLLAALGALPRAPVHNPVDLGAQPAEGRAAQDPAEREVARRRHPLFVRYRTHSSQRRRPDHRNAAREPLVQGAWLREGLHITAVGADDPSKCELDSTALQRATSLRRCAGDRRGQR